MKGSPLTGSLVFLEEGVPSLDEIAHMLHSCRKRRDWERAHYLHGCMCNMGLETHRLLGNNLVLMMVEVGLICDAQRIFDRLLYRTERSWTSMIVGYSERGKTQQAFTLYLRLQHDALVHPSGYTFVALLKACTKLKDLNRGLIIHAEAVRMGSAERDPFVGSALVDMYAKCGSLTLAREVLDWLPLRDVVSWTALVAGYADHGLGEEALECLEQMLQEGITANMATFVCGFKACSCVGAVGKGQELHAEVERMGLSNRDVVVGTALVDMYCKYGLITKAQEIFDKLLIRNAVSWTTLIVGYTENECSEEALWCFDQMLAEGVSPDNVALVCTLKACGKIGAMRKGGEIHADIERRGLLGKDNVIGNTLVDMYVKCGSLSKAQEVFDRLPVRSVVSWTVLLAGYAEQVHGDKALEGFECMQFDGVSPDAIMLVCSLQACGSVGAIDRGQEIHAEIERKGLLEEHSLVGNTLVDMYAKCGSLTRAHEVFDKLCVRDVVSWTALIAGYAQLGESEDVCQIFEEMIGDAVNPDPVTFIIVLDACGRKGLSDKSEMYLEAMSKQYGILPSLEHHIGMVGLLCRVGQLEKAVASIQKIQNFPNLVLWHILLDACRNWGNANLGLQAFEQALHLNEKDGGVYVSLSHIYADAQLCHTQEGPVMLFGCFDQ